MFVAQFKLGLISEAVSFEVITILYSAIISVLEGIFQAYSYSEVELFLYGHFIV